MSSIKAHCISTALQKWAILIRATKCNAVFSSLEKCNSVRVMQCIGGHCYNVTMFCALLQNAIMQPLSCSALECIVNMLQCYNVLSYVQDAIM